MSREHVQVSVTALVQCGHLVSPARRVVNAIPIPDAPTEVPDWQVGAWKLLQRQSAGTTKDCQKGDLFQCTLRIQAKCGIYCEVRSLERHEVTSDFHTQLSSYGMLRMDQSAARCWREPRVDFQVSKGSPTPFLRFTEGEDGSTLKEETLSAQGEVETWSKLLNAVGGSIGSITALELDSEDLAGLWIFAGNIFLRIIGVPKSQSLLGSHCCRSLTQLEHFQGQDAVQNELRKFEVLVGEVEQPGLLRARHSTWEGAGRLLLDARPEALEAGPAGGAVELQLEDGLVIHREPDGKQLRWRVKEWTLDPFTVPAPEIPSEPEAASESESVSESVRKKQQKDAKAASKGAAPKAKAKAKAQAAQPASPKKEEKETDDEKEEKEVKKKKHKKNKEEDRERKRAVSESRSSSEVKRKKKKDKSRGRSERKDKKEKEKEKRKKKKAQRSPSRSRSKSRSKRRKKTHRRSRSRRKASASRKSSHSEVKKEEKKSTKEKHIQEVPEELPEREIRLRRFAEQSKLIPQAMEALRNLKADLQDKIMEEGPIKEGDGNPIIVLMNRIKEVAEWAQQEAECSEDKAAGEAPPNAQAPETTPEVTKANGHEVPNSMLVRAFYLQNQLPEEALETLKALPGEVLMNVLMRGPLEASENPMLALQKRIEEAR